MSNRVRTVLRSVVALGVAVGCGGTDSSRDARPGGDGSTGLGARAASGGTSGSAGTAGTSGAGGGGSGTDAGLDALLGSGGLLAAGGVFGAGGGGKPGADAGPGVGGSAADGGAAAAGGAGGGTGGDAGAGASGGAASGGVSGGTGGALPADASAEGGGNVDSSSGGGTGGTGATGGAAGVGGAAAGGAAGSGGSTGAGGAVGADGGTGTPVFVGPSCEEPTSSSPAVDPCAGVGCSTAPASACTTPSTLSFAEPSGLCVKGVCKHAFADVSCANGCQNGACQALPCGAADCAIPPPHSCLDATVLREFAPGSCSPGGCVFDSRDVTCSKGCLNGACVAGSDLIVARPTLPSGSVAMERIAVDGSNRVHYAACVGGNVVYAWQDPLSFRSVTVESGVGTCAVAIAVTPAGEAHLAYRVGVAAQLRYARETSKGTFGVELVTTSDPLALDIAVDPSGAPTIAYVAGASNQLSVATRGASSWSSTLVATLGSAVVFPVVQVMAAAGGVVHVLGGEGRRALDTEVQPSAAYARWTGNAWTLTMLAQAMIQRRSMSLDPAGVATVARYAGNIQPLTFNGDKNLELLHRFLPGGRVDEQVRGMSTSSVSVAPANVPDLDGEATLVDVDGSVTRRIARDFWITRTDGIQGFRDFAMGADGLPRYLTSDHRILAPFSCRPDCTGGSRTCGGDGCGGSCGPCVACPHCSEHGTCTPLLEERISSFDTEALSAVADASGQLYVALGGAPESYIYGTEGNWKVMPSPLGRLSFIASGSHVFARAYTALLEWNGSDFGVVASGLPLYFPAAVDGLGRVYLVSRQGTTDLVLSVFDNGVMGAPTVIDHEPAGSTVSSLDLVLVAPDGHLHVFYTRKVATTLIPSHLEKVGAQWVTTSLPGLVLSAVLAPDGTLWANFNTNYMYKPPGSGWVFPAQVWNGTTWVYTSQVAPPGSLASSPDGRLFMLSSYRMLEFDPGTDTWPVTWTFPHEVVIAFTSDGHPHAFGADPMNAVGRLRHLWLP